MMNELEKKIFPEGQDTLQSVKGALEAMHLKIEIDGGRIKIDGEGVTGLGLMSIMADLLKAITDMVKNNVDAAEAHAIVGSGIFVYLEDEMHLEPWRMFTDQKPDCFKALDNEEECPSAQDGEKERANNAKENNDK